MDMVEVFNGKGWSIGLVSVGTIPRMGYLKREDTTCYSIRPGFVQGMSIWHFSVSDDEVTADFHEASTALVDLARIRS